MSKIFVLAGPSGSGKSTLLRRLFAAYPDRFGFSVSHTTRKPRPGEADGKDYHFVSVDTMQDEIAKGNFIESAQFSGNYYGTSYTAVADVLNSNRSVFLDIDMQGVKTIQSQLAAGTSKFSSTPKFIFITPPSVEDLEARLRGRGTENEESLQKRLSAAKGEMEWGLAPGSVDVVILNDDVERAYSELCDAVL